MMKFETLKPNYGYIGVSNSKYCLIRLGGSQLGDIVLYKKCYKEYSHCFQNNEYTNYHGIENALVGRSRESYPFTPKRITVIQMK